MFSSLWRRQSSSRNVAPDERSVARTNAPVLRFRGELQLETDGSAAPDYVAGDPYHRICVFAVDGGGHAVVIEFHQGTTCTIDGEVVQSVEELDDFFCVHAAEQFPEMTTGNDPASLDRERRILAGYDQQVMEIVRSLGGKPVPPSSAVGRQDVSGDANRAGKNPHAPGADGDPDVG